MKPGSILRISGALAALALMLALNVPFVAAQTADSKQISSLLSEAQHHADLAEDDASTLQGFTRSKLSWQTHGKQLELMKAHVNDLGKVTKQLNDLRSEGSPWQQEAIDQINPLLQDMADHLTATMNHLNENQNRVHMPAYQDYVHGNHELANKTVQAIKDFVDYDKAKSQSQALEQKLELPAVNEGA